MTPPNDWEIKKCLRLSLAILLAAVGLVGLAALGFDIPILRQIVGFIFLTFIPGILILRILKIHNLGIIQSTAYSVGLSISFLFFTGLFANFVLPFIGISKPIFTFPIMTTLAIFTLILGAVAYKRDKDFSAAPKGFNIGKIAQLPYLFLFLLPLLAIFGAHLVNLYQNNFLLLFFIIVICSVVAMVAFDRLPRNAYPLAIVMIGVSLLLHISLISPQLFGSDIHVEYYFQNLVTQNSYWDFSIPGNVNSCLSIVMLNPIYSLLLNMDAIWVFKIIYPLIFCLVPLTLFHLFREQIDAKKAFFSAFFFMAMITFFIDMTTLARQQIAELFFAFLLLLLIDRKLALSQRTTLFIVFALSLVASHYALGYICLYLLIVGWGIVALIKSRAGKRAWGWLTHKFGGLAQSLTSQGAFPHKIMAIIVCIYLIFTLAWYGGIAQGTALKTILSIGESQYALVPTEPGATEPGATEPGALFEPTEREALVGTAIGLDFPSASPLGKGFRIFQYLTQLFIVIGFAWMILKPKGFKFKPEYVALTVGAVLILLACVVIPRFSSYLNVSRLYHICLLLLAPLLVVGGEAIWRRAATLGRSISSRLRLRGRLALSANQDGTSPGYLRFLALAVLVPYFLFNSGSLFELTSSQLYGVTDSPSSLALSSYRLDMPVFDQNEAEAANWLAESIDDSTLVYADEFGRLLLYDRLYGQVRIIPDSGEVAEEAYIFLRTWNVERQELRIAPRHGVQVRFEHVSLSDMPALLEGHRLVYNNGAAQIWAPV